MIPIPGEIREILDTMPLEMSFIDKNDTVKYFNKLNTREIFPRPEAVVGKKVQNCHPQKSLEKVEQILQDFKAGKREVAEFWIDMKGKKIYIRYFAVRNDKKEYLGCLEVSQDITAIQKLTGEKRLI